MQDNKDLMKKTLLLGRHGVGKTTLKQALRGEEIHYVKTQYMQYGDWLIDSPGEYAEVHGLSSALAIYSYEADIVAMLIAADDDYSLFPPCCTSMVNREVIGIITGIDKPRANVAKAENWLRLAGCKKIFPISSYTDEGIRELADYLNKED